MTVSPRASWSTRDTRPPTRSWPSAAPPSAASPRSGAGTRRTRSVRCSSAPGGRTSGRAHPPCAAGSPRSRTGPTAAPTPRAPPAPPKARGSRSPERLRAGPPATRRYPGSLTDGMPASVTSSDRRAPRPGARAGPECGPARRPRNRRSISTAHRDAQGRGQSHAADGCPPPRSRPRPAGARARRGLASSAFPIGVAAMTSFRALLHRGSTAQSRKQVDGEDPQRGPSPSLGRGLPRASRYCRVRRRATTIRSAPAASRANARSACPAENPVWASDSDSFSLEVDPVPPEPPPPVVVTCTDTDGVGVGVPPPPLVRPESRTGSCRWPPPPLCPPGVKDGSVSVCHHRHCVRPELRTGRCRCATTASFVRPESRTGSVSVCHRRRLCPPGVGGRRRRLPGPLGVTDGDGEPTCPPGVRDGVGVGVGVTAVTEVSGWAIGAD